uniref:Protein containing DDE Tnp 4 domain n=1 Tax=Rhipicephalus zambeziensis TaxID=60191 RepID=A0A224Z151_9ACAR
MKTVEVTMPTTCAVDVGVSAISTMKDSEAQTELTIEYLKALEEDNHALRNELQSMRDRVNTLQMTRTSLEQDDSRVKFYTGIPSFAILISLFTLIEKTVPHGPNNALSKFQELILTLMRLRLGVPLQDLAYRFEVSQSTATRVVERWITAMHVRLRRLVEWPDREQLQQTMPLVFRRAFGTSVAVILDCFEVFIERPSSMLPRAQTWSRYKHHNTVKYLIGIAPQGVITFISQGWGGRTSDKRITESCGILNNLLPGDTVLADRGFTIGDAVSIHRARLEVPSFTKGKPQLSAWEVEKTRKIANVRIHVERVIGLLRRKYTILSGTVPIELLTARSKDEVVPFDKVVAVCCALTNLSKSVVPFD